MSYYSYTMTERIYGPGRGLWTIIKLGLISVFLMALAYLMIWIYESPKYQRYLPATIHSVIKDLKVFYISKFKGDLVVFTKEIGATKLIAKDNQVVRYSNGLAAVQQSKVFLINKEMSVDIKVEVFGTAKVAELMHKAFGGDTADQLNVGAPSFFKSHGVDEAGKYYLTVLSQFSEKLITVTYFKQLNRREWAAASGPQGETYLSNLADKLLEPAIAASKKQIDRVSRIK